jgi:coenzyme F420-reducing hydrogenase alpha subunit
MKLQNAQPYDLERDVSELSAQTSDAENALEALRLVANTISELERGRQIHGHGGAQAPQLEALEYLVRTAQQHVRAASEATDRIETATASGKPQSA